MVMVPGGTLLVAVLELVGTHRVACPLVDAVGIAGVLVEWLTADCSYRLAALGRPTAARTWLLLLSAGIGAICPPACGAAPRVDRRAGPWAAPSPVLLVNGLR